MNVDTVRLDCRDAWRSLRRSPAAAAVAVLTLALGVGANTAVFSVFESILIKPLPYPNGPRLVAIAQTGASGTRGVSAWTADEWKRRGAGLDAVGLYTDGQWVSTGDGEPEVFRGQRVNADFFAALGVRPLRGRLLTDEDDRPPRASVVVLTYELWSTRFGADPSAVGRVLTLNGARYRIVGVLDRGFQPLRMSNPAEEPRMFAPLGYDPAAVDCRTCAAFAAIGRLAPGVPIGAARDAVSAAMRRLQDEYPADVASDAGVRLDPLKERLTGARA